MSVVDKIVLINLVMFLFTGFFDSLFFKESIMDLASKLKLEFLIKGWVVITCMSIPVWISITIFNA